MVETETSNKWINNKNMQAQFNRTILKLNCGKLGR